MKPDRLLVAVSPLAGAAQSSCPSWCEHEHLGDGADAQGFHHDGAVTTIELDTAVVPGETIDLFVNASQLAQRGHPTEPSLVELQDEHHTLFLLTPLECLALSQALLAAAAQIAIEDEHVTARVKPLVRDLEATLALWRDNDTG